MHYTGLNVREIKKKSVIEIIFIKYSDSVTFFVLLYSKLFTNIYKLNKEEIVFRKNIIVVLIVLSILSLEIFSQTEADKNKIDNFIQTVQKKLNLQTGLTIGIVVGNKVFFQRGYGYLNIEEKIKADENTPFYIASATKSFTAALTKILAEEDTLDIDISIDNYLPDFHFEKEPLNTQTISIRDLLTHRHGIFSIPAVVRTAYTGQLTKEKLFEIYKNPRFTGIQFNYTNDGYVFTSLIIDKVMNKSWCDLMKEKIFIPLKMNNTSCRISDYKKAELPKAYNTKNGEVETLPFLKTDKTMHAAGGIVSTTNDLCNWLIFNLNDGEFNGKQILSRISMREIHSPQIRLKKTFWEYYRFAYGLGWYLSDYNDELLIHHFGGYAGARSHISFMPEYNIGVVSLTNDDGDGFYVVDLIADYAYNVLTDKEDADEIAEKELQIILDEVEKEKAKETEKDESTEEVKSKYDYEKLTGHYTNDDFGEIKITNNDQLFFEFGNLTGNLKPISETEFQVDLTAFKVKIDFVKEEDQIIKLIFKGPSRIEFTKLK